MNQKVVVRYAPSPTGPLHMGGVRTALYNYLLAKKYNGRFILRIEDTDRTRFVPGAEEHIVSSFDWIGIKYTEGAHMGGNFGPYRQSERHAQGIYTKYAEQLIEEGHAYYAFDTEAELTAMREKLEASGNKNTQYNYITREGMRNSLTLPGTEVLRMLEDGVPHVIRMKMPKKEEVRFQDIVRDWVVFHSAQLDDKVLVKSDGMPTYHLAHLVDDHLMEVTHVIRGEEWLSSTPLHILLYRALGWEDSMPKFAHLPLIMNPNGVGKMSKRQAAVMGFSIYLIEWMDPETQQLFWGYKEKGYLPEAMMNYLALQGWSPGHDEEVMDEDRLIELFTLERLGNSATNFDPEKLKWFNQTYLRKQSPEQLLTLVKPLFQAAGRVTTDDYYLSIIALLQERVVLLHEFIEASVYFFEAPSAYDAQMAAKNWKKDTPELMTALRDAWEGLDVWSAPILEETANDLIESMKIGKGKVLAPLRLLLTGVSAGPGAFDIAGVLGKEETISRFNRAIALIQPS